MLRRPRIKAIANLTARRPIKIEPIHIIPKTELKEEENDISGSSTRSSLYVGDGEDGENKDRTNNSVPKVNIPPRKPKITPNIQKRIEKPVEILEEISPQESVEIEKQIPIIENGPNDSLFKSPTDSPSMRNFQTSMKLQIPSNLSDIIPLNKDEPLKCPLSPTKMRQRVRPTPYFTNRRNSIQGNTSESEDEPRRQRHHSTSSNQSNPGSYLPRPGFFNTNRIRTESSCSNASDISMVRDVLGNSKSKRGIRSDECIKMVEAKKEFKNRFPDAVPDKSKLTVYDLIYYNPVTNPMTCPNTKEKEAIEAKDRERRMSISSSPISLASLRAATPALSIKEEENSNSMPVPQLKLGPNGEMMLDEKSLVIETTGDKEARQSIANFDVVFHDEFSGSQGFYKRQKRTRDWPPEETIRFYRCLHTIGTDFSLMLALFPTRNRRDLKLKFKKEEKINLGLINKALLNPKAFNIDDLKDELAKDDLIELQRKTALAAERDRLKQERLDNKKNSIKSLIRDAPKKRISRAERIMTEGDFLYENPRIKRVRKAARPIPESTEIYENENEKENSSSPVNESNEEIFNGNTVHNSQIEENVEIIEAEIETSEISSTDEISNEQNVLPSFNEVLPSQNNKFIDFSNIFTAHQDIHDNNSEDVSMKDLDNSRLLRSHDILNMEIIFDNISKNQSQLIEHETSDVKIESLSDLNNVPKIENEKDAEYETIVPEQEQSVDEEADDDDDDDDDDSLKEETLNPLDGVDISSLVVLKTNDSKNPKDCIYKIYSLNQETGLIDEDKPLDLPEDVIQLIVESMIV